MKVAPTLEGGLCIEPESDTDWTVLTTIVTDAGRPAHLAESLADLMDSESEWEDLVLPDLRDTFEGECRYVQAAVTNAREKNEQAIFITPQGGGKWYGAINQARLALQARYQLHKIDSPEEAGRELQSAYFRERFYLMLQSMLIEYVIDPGE